MSAAPSSSHKPDVVELLEDHHEHIRGLFAIVTDRDTPDRQRRFEELRRFLAVHETAEEMVVHPRAREAGDGDSVVDARLKEENEAKKVLSDLDGMKVDDPSFTMGFARLRTAVLAHAENEEREEFPGLRQHTDAKTLQKMAQAVRAAEALAPTHPHPGVESLTANLMVGPVAAVVDRARDAVRAVMGRP